ncbi:hypothetical protein V2J09_005989 [Rumex salicifolius]
MGGSVVVLLPLPLKSHFDLMLQLGRVLFYKGGFSISVICTRFNSPDPARYPEFTFHVISDTASDRLELNNVELFFAELNKSCVEQLRECLSGIALSAAAATTSCLITDTFWYSSQAVANSLGLRRFVLDVNMSFFLTALEYQRIKHLSIQDKEARVEELLPLKIKDLPMIKARDPTLPDEVIPSMLREIKASDGIIFNSFKELEPHAHAKVEDALSIPVFTCGPIHLFNPTATATVTDTATITIVADTAIAIPVTATASCIIPWLDTQLHDSVLYISLGTLISIDKSEFLELAWGIAASNQPFLWSVRPGLVRGSNDDDLVLLPEDFTKSVKGRGLVVSWAPQQEVLAHPSVGGFWTHGGWNSILESIHAGVPMVCLPFLGDQMSNARYVNDIWKIGLYFEERMERREIEKAIKRLMVDKGGVEMREEAKSWQKKAKECVEVGGSSYKSLDKLVAYIRNRSSHDQPY